MDVIGWYLCTIERALISMTHLGVDVVVEADSEVGDLGLEQGALRESHVVRRAVHMDDPQRWIDVLHHVQLAIGRRADEHGIAREDRLVVGLALAVGLCRDQGQGREEQEDQGPREAGVGRVAHGVVGRPDVGLGKRAQHR